MAHNSAVLALGVAIGFINPGSLSGTLGNTIVNFLKFLKSIDNLTDRLAPWNLAITYGKAACRTVSKITQEAVFEIQDGLFRARVILNGRLEEFIAAADEIIPANQIDVQPDGTLILRANNQEMPLAGSLASGKKLIADALGITEDLLERFRKLGLRDFEIEALLKKYQSLRTPDEVYDLLKTCELRNAPALAQDLTKDVNFGGWLFQNVEEVKAWEGIVGHSQLRVDVDVLKSISKALDDGYLKTLNIDQVITNKWTKHGFGCPTCINGTKPWINELIDQLDYFKQFKEVDGYQTVLNQLLYQGKTQAIGSHWVMKFTKQKNLSPSKFEDYIDEATGDFSADIIETLPDGSKKFTECKSWGSQPRGMSNVPKQMINYFNTQNNLSNFQFQFDPERWVPSPSDLYQALKSNYSLFNTVDDAVWDKYVAMVQSNVIDIPYGDVDALIDRITSPIIFSQIINPL